MRYKKRKRSSINWFKVVLIGIAWFSITLIGNIAYYQYIAEPIDYTPPITTQQPTQISDTEDIEAILLATKDKLIDANVFIQVNYDAGVEIGSGTIIDQDDSFYYAITNYHVIDGNNNVIDSEQLITSDGVASDFEIMFQDTTKDLAYIRLSKDNREVITPLVIDSEDIPLGEMVVSIGNPFGNIASVDYGMANRITYLQELEISHTVIEHDSTLANGSSGGALTNIYGHLIGINTWELNHQYYAIPISVINTFLEENI